MHLSSSRRLSSPFLSASYATRYLRPRLSALHAVCRVLPAVPDVPPSKYPSRLYTYHWHSVSSAQFRFPALQQTCSVFAWWSTSRHDARFSLFPWALASSGCSQITTTQNPIVNKPSLGLLLHSQPDNSLPNFACTGHSFCCLLFTLVGPGILSIHALVWCQTPCFPTIGLTFLDYSSSHIEIQQISSRIARLSTICRRLFFC